MATTPTNYGTFITKRLSSLNFSLQRNPTLCFRLPYNNNTSTSSLHHPTTSLLHITNAIGKDCLIPTTKSRDDQELRKGAEVLVEALEREGVTHVFSYPMRFVIETYQALRLSKQINSNIVPSEMKSVVFVADGYARASNCTGVCLLTTSDTDAMKGLANAMLDNIPLIVIYSSELQVIEEEDATALLDKFPVDIRSEISFEWQVAKEEIVKVTKQDYLVLDADDIPRIVREAFYLAQSGHPGPVAIDIPNHVLKQLVLPKWNNLPPLDKCGVSNNNYNSPTIPEEDELYNTVQVISQSKKPVLYVGGGCLKNLTEELIRFVELTGIPVATPTITLMGPGERCLDDHDELFLGMPGTVSANYAADHSDLLLAIGVRLDDPKFEAFASRCGGKIIHIDNDPLADIGNTKIKQPITSVCVDINLALKGINRLFESTTRFSFSAWKEELKNMNPMRLIETSFEQEAISPQYAIQVLNDLTKGRAIITTGAWKYQTWVAQIKKYRGLWLRTSQQGFGLLTAAGAAAAKPHTTVVDIEDYGGFFTTAIELHSSLRNLPIKIMLLDNYQQQLQHVLRSKEYESVKILSSQDMLWEARCLDIPAASVTKKGELREAIRKMLESPGMYLLDVIVPQDEELMRSFLPMEGIVSCN